MAWLHAFATPTCAFLSKPANRHNNTLVDKQRELQAPVHAKAPSAGLGAATAPQGNVFKKKQHQQPPNNGIPPSPSIEKKQQLDVNNSNDIKKKIDNGEAKVYEVNGRIYEELPWTTATLLAERIVEAARAGNYDCVLAITRGGLAPAALVAEGLGIRNVLAATVMFYTDKGDVFFGLSVPRFLSFPNSTLLEGRRVLVVDDVWDSGRTASAVRDRALRAGAQQVAVAVLHYKNENINNIAKDGNEDGKRLYAPDYFGTTTNRWILYPWEVLAIEQMSHEE